MAVQFFDITLGDRGRLKRKMPFISRFPHIVKKKLAQDCGFVGQNATRIAGFIATYADYLVHLASTYKNMDLPIFCAAGPITHSYAPYVQAAMTNAAARGIKNTHFVSFDTPVDRCGHPDYDGAIFTSEAEVTASPSLSPYRSTYHHDFLSSRSLSRLPL